MLNYFFFDDMNRTPIESIQITRNQSLFARKMADIGENVVPSAAVSSLDKV
jgi:carbamoylphosphate synthase large subunit